MAEIIDSNVLKPEDIVDIPTPTPDTTNYGGITGGVMDSIVNDYNTLNKQLTDKQASQEEAGSDIVKLMEGITNKTADIAVANKEAGVDTERENLVKATTLLSDLNAQATSLNREAQAIPLITQERNRNTGATDRGVAPQDTGALRQNAIKALSIAQQSDIAFAAATGSQMRLQAAKDKAQQIIDLKYKPLEDALAIKEKQYELNKDVLSVYDKKRTEALTLAIDKEKTALADKKALEKGNADKVSEYAKYAMDAGQSDIAGQISALDTSSKTFKQDLATLQAKIKNPMMALDIAIKQANLAKIQKETRLLGEPTATEKKAMAAALTEAKTSLPAMYDKLDTIDLLKKSTGLKSRVGANILSRKSPGFWGGAKNLVTGIGVLDDATGASKDFAAGVQNLTEGLTLDNLIAAKERGATFGALSEGELRLLAASATRINNWELKDDKGKGRGIWDIDEASFNREMDNIKRLTQRAIELKEGTLISPEERSLLDDAYSNQPVDPADYF